MTTIASPDGAAALVSEDIDLNAETMMNLSLLDPPHYGWTAAGGIADLLPPVERSRRSETKEAFLKKIRRKERSDARKQERVEVITTFDTPESAVTFRQASVTMAADSQETPIHWVLPVQNSASTSIAVEPSAPTDVNPLVQRFSTDCVSFSIMHNTLHTSTTSNSSTSNNELSIQISSLQNHVLAPANPKKANPLFAPILNPGSTIADPAAIRRMHPNILIGNPNSSAASITNTTLAPASAPVRAPQQAPEMIVLPAAPQRTQAPLPPALPPTLPLSEPDAMTAPTLQHSNEEKKQSTIIGGSALNDEGIIDMYIYHRGREGSEPRDIETGELLCDVGPTDTSYGWDQKRLSTSVTISFPLGEGDDDFHYYKEAIEWDLADPKSPTPMAFAVNVAHEYGLNFGQTMDLATDIQAQLDEFQSTLATYVTPLTSKDANEKERGRAPASAARPLQLYGVPVPVVKEGLHIPSKQKQITRSLAQANQAKTPRSRHLSIDVDEFSFRSDREYRVEVIKRAKAASMKEVAKISEANGDDAIGILEAKVNGHCHICHGRRPLAAVFGCGNPAHSYCEMHCTDRLGFSIAKPISRPITFDHCPICSGICECMKCRRRVDSVAIEFKKRCIAQGCLRLEDAEFEDILLYICGRGTNPKKGGVARVNKVNGLRPAQEIRKIPLNDFPRETSSSVDLEPGTLDDYRSVFTSEGTFLRKEPLFLLDESETVDGGGREEEIQEDGSVDYCLVCRKPGDLLCCDRCPRAYHTACVDNGIDPPDGRWECHVCIKEKAGLDQDLVDGRSYLHQNGLSSIEMITASLVKLPNGDGFVESHQILSMIHEMLSKLMDYEFGYIFRAPVDCKLIPSYKKIVKKPMDLGTICSRLENGHYAKRFLSISNSWDDVLAAVLEDIELVWHNCFTFNLEGSAVYKMAEVHRRRYLEMRRRSFDHLLSNDVKCRVASFVERCELERIPDIQAPTEKPAACFSVPSNHRMDVKVAYGGNKRDVAILDPESGMLAKIYTSQKSACLAANFLRALGHKCEQDVLSDHVLKNYFRSSAYDPSQLLFGYRWLFLEDLQGGRVIFEKYSEDRKDILLDGTVHKKESPPGFIEMRDGDTFYMFLSIEEALCFDGLPKDVSLHQVRAKFCELAHGEWTAVVGFNWRRVEPEVPAPTEEGTENSSTEGQLIVKKDSITGRRLLGFDTVAAAYKDWLTTCLNSPMFSQQNNTSIKEFSSKFLDKDGHVDGIVWKSMNSKQFVSPPEGTKQTGLAEHTGMQNTAINGLDKGDENINTSESPSIKRNREQHRHPGSDAFMKAAATTATPQELSDLANHSSGKNGTELIHSSLPILEPTPAVISLGPTSEAHESTANGLKRSIEINAEIDSSAPAFKRVAVDATERTTPTMMNSG